jgi:predicted TIM-barrel fold metal-dependent hydrolase
MAKNGFRIFDTDTHVGPSMDVLEGYMDAAEREQLAPFAEFRSTARRTGQVTYRMGARKYERRLGKADSGLDAADRGNGGYMAGFTGAHKGREPSPAVDHDVHSRIADMDFEGVDVNLLLPSGWFGAFTTVPDVSLELAAFRAYNRWMADYCGAYPERLGGVIILSGRDIDGGMEELRRCANEAWPWGIFVYAPYGKPLDHPDFEPYWAAAQEHDLSVVLHTFTVMPPYAPGGLDTWENLWLQRSAAHPWCGMRNMASVIGSGAMDRYPNLRVGCLEAGHSWLPFWVKRLDEHAETIASALPALQHTPSEYVQSGRYFQSIEMSEGPELTEMVAHLLGDGILMYASDYPHGESWFPKSVETVMGWSLSDDLKQKLFWDNPLRFYRRYAGVKSALTAARV